MKFVPGNENLLVKAAIVASQTDDKTFILKNEIL